MWHWAAFVLVSAIYIVLAAAAVGIGYLRMRKISGAPRTRRTLADGVKMIRRSSSD
jgi:hypothetical protein